MGNTRIVSEVPSDFDPFLWRCDSCGKEKQYTEEEIEKTKKPYADPHNHPNAYPAGSASYHILRVVDGCFAVMLSLYNPLGQHVGAC